MGLLDLFFTKTYNIANLESLSIRQKKQSNDLSLAPRLQAYTFTGNFPMNHEWSVGTDYTIIVGATISNTGAAPTVSAQIFPDKNANLYFETEHVTGAAANQAVNCLRGVDLPLILTHPQGIRFRGTNGIAAGTLRVLYYYVPKPYGVD